MDGRPRQASTGNQPETEQHISWDMRELSPRGKPNGLGNIIAATHNALPMP